MANPSTPNIAIQIYFNANKLIVKLSVMPNFGIAFTTSTNLGVLQTGIKMLKLNSDGSYDSVTNPVYTHPDTIGINYKLTQRPFKTVNDPTPIQIIQ